MKIISRISVRGSEFYRDSHNNALEEINEWIKQNNVRPENIIEYKTELKAPTVTITISAWVEDAEE